MDAHHNWWGIGYMVGCVVVGIGLLLILMWRERHAGQPDVEPWEDSDPERWDGR